MLGDYLKGAQIHPGTGLVMEKSSSSGISLSALKERQQKNSQPPPFSVLSLSKVPDSDPVEFKLTLQEGWVFDRIDKVNFDAIDSHECEIAAQPMSDRPRPELTVKDGDFVSVYFETDEEGHVTSNPAIQADPTEQESDHHQPASGAGSGAGGYYYLKLFKFTISEGAPTINLYQQSDIEHPHLWTGENVGGGRYIHKEWNGTNATYDFRTLEQFEPITGDYGKVIVDPVGAELDAANDSIKFSAIAERETNPQINVDDDLAGKITIRGNNNNGGTLTWTDCDDNPTTILAWEDGLITSASNGFTAGCTDGLPYGTSGDILYHNGTNWVALPSPNKALITDGTYEHYHLIHDGDFPLWSGVV